MKSERDEQMEDEILNDVNKIEKINHHHGKRADALVKGMLQHSRTNTEQKNQQILMLYAMNILRLSYHGLRAKDKTFNADLKTDFNNSIGKINVVPPGYGKSVAQSYK